MAMTDHVLLTNDFQEEFCSSEFFGFSNYEEELWTWICIRQEAPRTEINLRHSQDGSACGTL